jgi:hypothetical protein
VPVLVVKLVSPEKTAVTVTPGVPTASVEGNVAGQVAIPVPLACGVTVEAAQLTVPSLEVNFTVLVEAGAIAPRVVGVIVAVKVTDCVATLTGDEEATATVVPV